MTLNTFHLSGVAAKSGMTRGVPRLKELLKVTQNPKATSLTIYMRPDLRASKEDARRLTQELEFTTLKDLVTVSRIYYDPPTGTVVAEDAEWLKFFSEFDSAQAPMSPWVIRLELDREKMFNKNITMYDIAFVLNTSTPMDLRYTDHNATQLIFRMRLLIDPKEKRPLDDLTLVKQLQNKILTQTMVRGLPGIKSVSFREAKGEMVEKTASGKHESVTEYVLDTLGTNFLDVMIHPDVDGYRLISNHVHDIYDNLGVEAARAILFREIFGLFEQAAPVNYRHVAILCDALTNRGRLMSADRIGVNKKGKIGPLAKASFEQTEDIMLRAALFGEMDPVTGVSANIMTGQPIQGGTSFSQVLLDEVALLAYLKEVPPKVKEETTIVDFEPLPMVPACDLEDLAIPEMLPPKDEIVEAQPLPDIDVTVVD